MNSRSDTANGNKGRRATGGDPLEVVITSFGYKEGPPPPANVVFDVRFLKNPYWIAELRPLTGLDPQIQKFVLEQPLAVEFLDSVTALLAKVLPSFDELNIDSFEIAFGCTGGQHRSCAMAEALALSLEKMFPSFRILRQHRELAKILAESGAHPSSKSDPERDDGMRELRSQGALAKGQNS